MTKIENNRLEFYDIFIVFNDLNYIIDSNSHASFTAESVNPYGSPILSVRKSAYMLAFFVDKAVCFLKSKSNDFIIEVKNGS
jgi:hypothetical protein